ncbi:MAG: s-methyl-5-thioribose-1-phosphate isomerase [Clostridia bacterium]|nr:s-methyl-5-thioribose-1-phosphate isomerase [Clostridia bacterium]
MRNDHNLAFLLKYENIARFENGCVYILDRRIYPRKKVFVRCQTHGEVAAAIRDMVTQSYGPFQAASVGMSLAAHECRELPAKAQLDYLSRAATVLATARPTTEKKMRLITDGAEKAAAFAIAKGESATKAILDYTLKTLEDKYARIAKIGHFLAEKIPKDGTVMTQCYADCDLGMMLRACRERNNDIKLIVPETRPYLQGARLTASVIYDMGFDVTLITDNMPAFAMLQKHVDVFTTAADVICMDGHVVNKVGTYQIAIAAKRHGIPYYCTGNPNAVHPAIATVKIEQRNPEEVLHAMGRRTAKKGVKGYYPAFDITPPDLVGGIVTDKGILGPYELQNYFFLD